MVRRASQALRKVEELDRATTEKLVADLQAVITDAEDLLQATADQTGARIEQARTKAMDTIRASRERLENLGHAIGDRTNAYAHAIDDQVHENPWTAIGVAAGVGLVMGVLLGRR